jgi:hypothetical protein
MLGRIKDRIRRTTSLSSEASNSASDNLDGLSSNGGGGGRVRMGRDGAGGTNGTNSSGHDPYRTTSTSLDYHAKLTDLASFDACVEASDALAASSLSSSSSSRNKNAPAVNAADVAAAAASIDDYDDDETTTGIANCSVIVSPDGDLWLMQPSTSSSDENEPNAGISMNINSKSFDDSNVDLDSSVIIGNDLKSAKELNGFSAMGWSAAATSLAIRQTEQTMRHTEQFLSQIHQAAVDSQKLNLVACQKLRLATGIGEYPSTTLQSSFPPTPLPKELRKNPPRPSSFELNSLSDHERMGGSSTWNSKGRGNSRDNNILELSPHRVGPLVYSGSSLYAAMIALELYYTRIPVPRPTVPKQLTDRADQTAERAYHREKTLHELQRRADQVEQRLQQAKEYAHQRWRMVHAAEELVTQLVEQRMWMRSQAREQQRMEAMEAETRNHEQNAVSFATSAEIWDIVAAATASMEDGDFTPIDFPSAPMSGVMDQTGQEHSDRTVHLNGHNDASGLPSTSSSSVINIPIASRAEIEQECSLPALRAAALAADDAVEDAAQALLNCLSILDTTRRSARVAAETSLLAACNAQAESLQRIVRLERVALQERMAQLDQLEHVTSQINVRQDLDRYITVDKKQRGGSTWMGDYDDGGIASALAILSSHVEGSTGMGPGGSPAHNQVTWSEESDEATSPEVLEDAINEIFDTELNGDVDQKESFDKTLDLLCRVAADRNAPRSKRSIICYALNAKRTSAELTNQVNFDALCNVFAAILSGCDHEAGGVANAKMCMMLSQTFYIVNDSGDDSPVEESRNAASPSSSSSARNKRIYVKSKLIGHSLWEEDEFWDQALYQCVTESLTHSGVMANFDRSHNHRSVQPKSEWADTKTLRWHDLTHAERSEAASQVHAVVFAQLGALAHSMMEFGCGRERSCAFVRRMSVRNQLPISQRTMLLQHLVGNSTGEDE